MDELPIEQLRSQPVNPSHVTIDGLAHYCTHNASVTIVYKVMHRPQFFTWTTHTAETTTLLEATRLQKLYTIVQHCNRTCNRILLVQYSIHIFNK